LQHRNAEDSAFSHLKRYKCENAESSNPCMCKEQMKENNVPFWESNPRPPFSLQM
jgi:hypothetical protein